MVKAEMHHVGLHESPAKQLLLQDFHFSLWSVDDHGPVMLFIKITKD